MTRPLTPEQGQAVARLRAAVAERVEAERVTVEAVRQARAAGWTWARIARFLNMRGEAARRRYRNLAPLPVEDAVQPLRDA